MLRVLIMILGVMGIALTVNAQTLQTLPKASSEPREDSAANGDKALQLNNQPIMMPRQDYQSQVISNPTISNIGRANAIINQNTNGNSAIINQTGITARKVEESVDESPEAEEESTSDTDKKNKKKKKSELNVNQKDKKASLIADEGKKNNQEDIKNSKDSAILKE